MRVRRSRSALKSTPAHTANATPALSVSRQIRLYYAHHATTASQPKVRLASQPLIDFLRGKI